jgi:hypothetical protein
MEEHGGEEIELTSEQEKVLQQILERVERSKEGLMKCLICDEKTFDRGLACLGPAPATTIMYGLCYPCKHLPDMENYIRERIRLYLLSIGREDLLEE